MTGQPRSAHERRSQLAILPALLAVGCIDAFETPSAYEGQRYLCADEHAAERAALLETCRAELARGARCGGVISYTGRLEGLPLTVESVLVQTTLRSRESPTGQLSRVDSAGSSPYFGFVAQLKSVGGQLDPPLDGERVFTVSPAAPDDLDDELISLFFRISVGGESVDFEARQGTVVIGRQSTEIVSGRFDGEFSDDGDAIAGCFDFLPTELRTTTE